MRSMQHRFHTGKFCDLQLIITINDFANCLNENKQIDTIFFDFSKAFDKVPHQRLLTNYLIVELKVLCWRGYKTTLLIDIKGQP